jgi:hypothetical protein
MPSGAAVAAPKWRCGDEINSPLSFLRTLCKKNERERERERQRGKRQRKERAKRERKERGNREGRERRYYDC